MIAASSLTCLWMFGTRGLQSRRGGRKEKSYIGSWVLADPHHRRFPMFLSGSKRRCRKPVKSRLSFTSQVDIKFIIHHLTHIRPRVVRRSSGGIAGGVGVFVPMANSPGSDGAAEELHSQFACLRRSWTERTGSR